MDSNFFPRQKNPVINRIPDAIPDQTRQVYTPRNPDLCPQPNNDPDWYDEPDYTQAVAQGMQEVLQDARPRLSKSEAEEQMHLAELRRLADGYTENDARVISEVLAKNYPLIMFDALGNEFSNMKYTLDTITGAVNSDTIP